MLQPHDSIALPMEVRLTVDRMQHAIVQYLSDYEGLIAKAVTAKVKDYFEHLDLDALISEYVQKEAHYEVSSRMQRLVQEEVHKILDGVLAAYRIRQKEQTS